MKYGLYKSLWDPSAHECVHECPDDRPIADASKTCMTCKRVNASAPYWNSETRECVAKCPELSERHMCKSCADDNVKKPYWDGTSCKSCAEAFPD